MVTGSDNPVGRRAAQMLAAQGGEVRAFVQVPPGAGASGTTAEDDPTTTMLRGLRCKVARGHLDDEAHVETALEQVHTVLHLLGRPTDDPDAYLERTATVIGAAIGAGCRRLVLLSDLAVGGSADGNAWIKALTEAEAMASDAPMESVVLRCAVVHGRDDVQSTAIAAGALGPDPAGAHWPVSAGDVATAAVLADAERDLDSSLHVVVSLVGPVRMATAEYAAALRDLIPAGEGDRLPDHALDLLTRTIEAPLDAMGGTGTPVAAAYVSQG
ncbi:NAD(P)H-binding protein [soil metagenome]